MQKTIRLIIRRRSYYGDYIKIYRFRATKIGIREKAKKIGKREMRAKNIGKREMKGPVSPIPVFYLQ